MACGRGEPATVGERRRGTCEAGRSDRSGQLSLAILGAAALAPPRRGSRRCSTAGVLLDLAAGVLRETTTVRVDGRRIAAVERPRARGPLRPGRFSVSLRELARRELAASARRRAAASRRCPRTRGASSPTRRGSRTPRPPSRARGPRASGRRASAGSPRASSLQRLANMPTFVISSRVSKVAT